MLSIRNILTISRFEARVLWRNWFFRIIALAGIGFLMIFNLAVFSDLDNPAWAILSNSWLMPYASMVMISIPQTAAVVFLATGLIRKDKKLDTNEVFFVRPITNLDYVLGKALALFKVFFALNAVLLCIPLIVNLTNPLATFNPLAFVIYPLVTSVPTIVFTTGIAFLLVTLLRNQPVAIVILLGISGVQLIYYFDQFSNILDFMAFRLPMLASEISGFVNAEFAFWQRLFYVVAGVAFLFMTAFFLDRLSSHRRTRITTGLIGAGLFAISVFIMMKLWDLRAHTILAREQMITVNGKWTDIPNVDIVSNSIGITPMGDQLGGTSDMVVRNSTDKVLTRVYFTLNPGLTIDEVTVNDQAVKFKRELQIVSIDEGISIGAGKEATIQIRYQGTIKESAAHLEVDQQRYESANNYFLFSLQKKYAFLESDYVLLTKDVLWYPDTEIGYNRVSPSRQRRSFVDFELKVTTSEGQVAVSQGAPVVKGNLYHFKPDHPLPQISLAIGPYLKKEIMVDSVIYAVYHYPENDFFVRQLDQIADTLSYLITDIVNEYEHAQRLSYPFRRLQFVETPLQFTAYDKIYEGHQAFLQPETVFVPEEGGAIREFDFRRQLRDMDRQAREQNLLLTDKQKQANVFNDLIKKVFTKQSGTNWVFDGRSTDVPDYSLFANYYAYNFAIISRDWPLLNRSIATYLRNDSQIQNDYSRNINGISFTEECNNLMRTSPIAEILTTAEFSKIQKCVSLKSEYLFSYLGRIVGEDALKAFLYDWVNTHQHSLTPYAGLREAIRLKFGVDIESLITKVYSDTPQPAFEIVELQKYEVLDGDRKRYQVLAQVRNSGENDGVIEVQFNTGNDPDDGRFLGRRNTGQDGVSEKLAVIRKGETRLLGFVLDDRPRDISINTLISRNIPSVITMSIGAMKQRRDGVLFEGERVITERSPPAQYEVIVDNEDPEFGTFSPIKPTFLRAYLDSRNATDKRYYGNWSRSYSRWLATTGSDFYGAVIRSAHFTRSGAGDKRATWTPVLTDEGFYDIYVYMRGKNQNEFQGGNNNRSFSYHYIINHADGQDDVNYNISNAEPGWNYLGSYYFNQTGGSVSLTDECDLRTVYADAIKFVKQ